MIRNAQVTIAGGAQGALSNPAWCTLFFGIALLFVAAAVLVCRSKKVTRLSKGALSLFLLGFFSALVYEGVAVLQNDRNVQPALKTISQWANTGYREDHFLAGSVFLAVMLVLGILTTSFTRVIHRVHRRLLPEPQGATVAVVISAVLFLLNGAVLAYWFNWLP